MELNLRKDGSARGKEAPGGGPGAFYMEMCYNKPVHLYPMGRSHGQLMLWTKAKKERV